MGGAEQVYEFFTAFAAGFLQQIVHVEFYGALGDKQPLGDLRVRRSRDELLQHLTLPCGKIMADRLMKHGPRRLSFSEALSEAEEMLEEKGYLSSDQDILISIVTDTDDRYERLSQEAEEVASTA